MFWWTDKCTVKNFHSDFTINVMELICSCWVSQRKGPNREKTVRPSEAWIEYFAARWGNEESIPFSHHYILPPDTRWTHLICLNFVWAYTSRRVTYTCSKFTPQYLVHLPHMLSCLIIRAYLKSKDKIEKRLLIYDWNMAWRLNFSRPNIVSSEKNCLFFLLS